MRWLIEVAAKCDVASLRKILAEAGGDLLTDHDPIPMANGTAIWEAVGPADLARKIKPQDPIQKISPSSEMSFF